MSLILVSASGVSNAADLPFSSSTITAANVSSSDTRRMPVRDDVDDEIVLQEDFEEGAEGWTTHDLTNPDTAWHKSDFLAQEEDNLLWWCGDTLTGFDEEFIGYNNIWLQFLDTPVLDLSGADEGLGLTFTAYWLLEDPRRVPPPDPWDGWDGWLVMISENGGDSFEPLNPVAPEYTAERISAAERFWDIGPTPGWVFESGEWDAQNDTTPEPDWVDVEFDLSDFANEAVVIRFLLLSDRAVSAPWNYYLRNSGVLIDDIVIQDNESIFLSNNCDDEPFPEGGELIPQRGPGFGDWWERTDETSHSGEWSMWHPDDHANCRNALDTPPFEVPEDLNTFFQYWVFCDLPDWDSDGNGQLDDFYQIFLSDDEGETWEYLTHDYQRDGAGAGDWEHYIPGTGYTGNIDLDLTDWAGQTVQLRWLFISDNDNGNGAGDGLFLDDIEVIGANRLPRDAGMENFHLPYPTTVGYRLLNYTVDMHNYGTRDLEGIWAEWTWISNQGGREYPIVPRPTIDSGDFEIVDLTDYIDRNNPGWTPSIPGQYPVWTRTNLGSNTADEDDDDQNPENDSVGVAEVRVWPSGIYELGYDNRTIQSAYPFDAGEGPAARFSPADAGLEEFSIAAAHFKFNGQQEGPAECTLHILCEGDEASPGQELLSLDITVPPDSCLPNDMTVPLWEREELRGLNGDFWFWIELQQDDNRPQIVGDELRRGEGRYFRFDGENAEPYPADLMMHAMVVTTQEVIPDLAAVILLVDFDEVAIERSGVFPFVLFATGLADVTITNVSTSDQIFVVDWPGETTLRFGEAISFDIMYTPPDENLHMARLIVESNDETPPEVDLVGSGVVGVADGGNPDRPYEFKLAQPYPNPFNNQTLINFSLDHSSDAAIVLYDLAGREIMTLAQGKYEAGAYQVMLAGDELAAGMYLVRLQTPDRTTSRKVVLIK